VLSATAHQPVLLCSDFHDLSKPGTRMVKFELDMSEEIYESMAIHSCYRTFFRNSLPPFTFKMIDDYPD